MNVGDLPGLQAALDEEEAARHYGIDPLDRVANPAWDHHRAGYRNIDDAAADWAGGYRRPAYKKRRTTYRRRTYKRSAYKKRAPMRSKKRGSKKKPAKRSKLSTASVLKKIRALLK